MSDTPFWPPVEMSTPSILYVMDAPKSHGDGRCISWLNRRPNVMSAPFVMRVKLKYSIS